MGSPHLPPPPLLEPAWYPDPTGRYEARYWDGRKWTSHISHYGATGADPLLRARWDRAWVRVLLRVAFWAAVAGAAWWAYDTYWPRDDRDLEAEQQLVDASALIPADLPAAGAWSRGTAPLVSPLELQAEDGELELAACEPFSSQVSDASDEPRSRSMYTAADGLRSVASATTIAGNASFAEGYLDELRTQDGTVAECLGLIWADALGPNAGSVSAVQAMQDPSFGDEAVWWRLSATDERGAFPLEVSVDVIFVRIDRVVSEFTFTGVVNPVGVDVERGVISVQIARTAELLAALEADEESDRSDDGA